MCVLLHKKKKVLPRMCLRESRTVGVYVDMQRIILKMNFNKYLIQYVKIHCFGVKPGGSYSNCCVFRDYCDKVQRPVLLLVAGSRVLVGSKNFLYRQTGDRKCGLIYLMTMFTGNTQENNS
jgi:hypothetical protein